MNRNNFHKPTKIHSKKFFDKSSYGDDWRELANQVKKLDNYTCRKCGYNKYKSKEVRYLEADHIIPITKGGKNTLSNLQTLCDVCHKKKSSLNGNTRHGKSKKRQNLV